MAVTDVYIAKNADGNKWTGSSDQSVATADGSNFHFVDNSTDKKARPQGKVYITNTHATNLLYYRLNGTAAVTAANAHGIVPPTRNLVLEGDAITVVSLLAGTGAFVPSVTGVENQR